MTGAFWDAYFEPYLQFLRILGVILALVLFLVGWFWCSGIATVTLLAVAGVLLCWISYIEIKHRLKNKNR